MRRAFAALALLAASPALAQTPTPGLPSIKSNFDTAAWLSPRAIPPSAAPDVVGAFRFICNASHLAYVDPIVFYNRRSTHLHQFFGNTTVNSQSTYRSLRSRGESTCNNALNRSAYWLPAMLNGSGGVVIPDYISIYYKRLPASSPLCQKYATACVATPRGLRYVFGWSMTNPAAQPTGAAYFNCDGPTAKPGHYPDIVTAAANCPTGNKLGAIINSPNCWDGKNLDSADHRSHMAYTSYGGWGYPKCPATHPYLIPSFTMGVWYTTDDTLDRSGVWDGALKSWHLSSDAMPGMPMRPGSTFHADWFGAWDDGVLARWTANCIDKMLNCNSGDLGDGSVMKMWPGFKWLANPRVVPVPR